MDAAPRLDAQPAMWRVVAGVAVSAAVIGFTSTAITVGTRGMARDLDLSLSSLSWIVNGYLLAGAATALLGGRLGDLIGRVNTLVLGAWVFGAGSALGAVAPGGGVLVAARVVQGIGAGLMLPAGVEVLVAFHPRKASNAFAIRSALYSVSFAIGPLVGGMLTDYVSWRWIFVGDLVLMTGVAVVVTPLFGLRSGVAHRRWGDWQGAVLFAALVLLVVLAADRSREWGWVSPAMAGIALAAVTVVVGLVVVERRSAAPLLHPSLLRNRRLLGANVATFGSSLGMIGMLYFFNAFAQSAATFDHGAWQVLGAFVPFVVSVVAMTAVSLWLKDRLSPMGPAAVGMGAMVVGFAMLGTIDADTTRPEIWLPLVLCGVGSGIANVGLNGAAVMGLPTGRLDEAAGVLSLSRFLGSALALALGTNTYLAIRAESSDWQAAQVPLSELLLGGQGYQEAVNRLAQDLRGPFEAVVRADTAEAFASTMRLTALAVGLTGVVAMVLLRPDRRGDGEAASS